MLPLLVWKDKESTPTYAISLSDSLIGANLIPFVLYPVSVPSDAEIIIFGADNHFAYSENAFTLLAPGTAPTSVTYEMDPQARLVTPGATVYIMSYVACAITMAFYSKAVEN
jgi:hypothetical protein